MGDDEAEVSALVDAIVEMARATDIPALKRARMKCERLIDEKSKKECEMDLEKIAQLLDAAVEAIEEIVEEDIIHEETIRLQRRVLASLAHATAIADTASTDGDGMLLVRRLVVEECERLVSRCRRAVVGGE